MKTYKAAPDTHVITSNLPLPGLGCVPINAFVIDGAEPVLVDTGAVVQSEAFLKVLRSVIDPSALAWIWLTHTDADHVGSLHQLLAENPRLRVATTFLGVGIMGLFAPLPMDRVYLVNPGETLKLRDRTLTAYRPPVFDNPSTTGLFDDKSRILFSSDCFGAALADPPERAADLTEKELHDGQVLWATIDAPWLHKADRGALATELEMVRRMEPAMILSSHLPAVGPTVIDRVLGAVADAPGAHPFVGPNQVALEQMLQQMAAGPAAP
jgi:flavorubredoxin